MKISETVNYKHLIKNSFCPKQQNNIRVVLFVIRYALDNANYILNNMAIYFENNMSILVINVSPFHCQYFPYVGVIYHGQLSALGIIRPRKSALCGDLSKEF